MEVNAQILDLANYNPTKVRQRSTELQRSGRCAK